MSLQNQRLRSGVDRIEEEVGAVFGSGYDRFVRGIKALSQEQRTQLMIELCDVFHLNEKLCREVARRAQQGESDLSDSRLKREMGELTTDLVTLFEAKYARFYNAILMLQEDQLIELMLRLCQLFAGHQELVAEVAALYKEHRLYSGSFEDRDWPEN